MVPNRSDDAIRDAAESDREAARLVTLTAYQEYAEMMPPQFWEGYRKNIVQALDETEPAQLIVATYAGEIVGSVLLYPPGASAYGEDAARRAPLPEMRLLAVHPSMRGRGIGTALTLECVHRAERAGAEALGLHTIDVMQAAIQIYERMGFVHMPELDVHPIGSTVVKGYRLSLRQGNVR
jgi:GNAT superfamily N-acetyltransferase